MLKKKANRQINSQRYPTERRLCRLRGLRVTFIRSDKRLLAEKLQPQLGLRPERTDLLFGRCQINGRNLRSTLRYMAWAHSKNEGGVAASGERRPVRCGRQPAPRATGRDGAFGYAGELARASVLASKRLSFSAETGAYTRALHHV